ncbi:aspartic peptidase A1 [Suillus spraguei]|nr:aspartic peptidase A1 [Suillus spraguei]
MTRIATISRGTDVAKYVMFSVASLLALLALSVTGSPVEVRNSFITVPMTRRLTFSNVTDILRHDEARVAAFREYSTHGRRADVPLTNANWGYTASVNIGFPPKTYNLIVDSHSSITWVSPGTTYVSGTGFNTKKPVELQYPGGSFEGTIFNDILSLSDELTVTGMRIGVAPTSHVNTYTYDGMLGIGPQLSSRGAIKKSPLDTMASVTDYLFAKGTISMPVVSIFFQPIYEGIVNYGELIFGRDDPTKYVGSIGYTDITTIPPHRELMRHTAGVVDCGTTFLYIASDAYERYQAVTGGTVNLANELLQISAVQYSALLRLKFYIGEEICSLSANAQIWPRSLNHLVSGVDGDIFLIVKGLSTPTGAGFDFINGYVFLERFYTVFDTDRSRVGFAPTYHTYSISN